MISYKKNLRKNKKAVELYVEVILYLVLIVGLGIVIFISNNLIDVSRGKSEKAPVVYSNYPSLYVKTFLLTEISTDDKKKLGFSQNDYVTIKDLIKLNTDDSKKIISQYSLNYNHAYKDSLDTFKKKYSDVEVNSQTLLTIKYDLNSLPNQDLQIKNNNYFFYFKDNNNKYIVISFTEISTGYDPSLSYTTPESPESIGELQP